MDLAALDFGLPLAQAAPAPAGPRQLEAILRWRVRWLRRFLAPRQFAAIRAVPLLLHAAFDHPSLGGDPPGVEGMRYRRGWGALGGQLELPPPRRAASGRKLVEAVIALASTEGVDVAAVMAPRIGIDERARVEERLSMVEGLLRSKSIAVRTVLLRGLSHAEEPDALHRVLCGGALLAGRLGTGAWSTSGREAAAPDDANPGAIAEAVVAAPRPLAALALMLLCGGGPARCPVEALRRSLAGGASARQLADPEVAAIEWACDGTALGGPLRAALRLGASEAGARGAAVDLGAPELSTGELLGIARVLALAAVKATRRGPARAVPGLWERVRSELLEAGVPRVLLAPLRDRLRGEMGPYGAPRLVPVRRHRHELLLSDGSLLARGRTPEQARARALPLLAGAFGHLEHDPFWEAAEARVLLAPAHPVALFGVTPVEAPQPPLDPLNRGPDRAFGIADTLCLDLVPGHRPVLRSLVPADAVERFIRSHLAGEGVEIIATGGAGLAIVARLSRAAAFLRRSGGAPPAFQAGGRVYLARGGRVLRYGLARFFARPRHCAPDPEAPDLSLAPEGGLAVARRWRAWNVVECRVSCVASDRAALLYLDDGGFRLRETVPLAVLDEWLRDTQTMLRDGPQPMILALRMAPEILDAGRGYDLPEPRTEIAVSGELPFHLSLVVNGERFGAGAELGWSAAAQAILASWPVGQPGRIAVVAANVSLPSGASSGMARLYARSLAVRRLRLHLEGFRRSYRRAPG